ncbi:tRNA (N(6)-L-threonylcarbamoyladenosine(37)-C(2))-methylthiotransferase MtaB [Brotaphodocola sp.]|uniref:tRNA (N(6)-L-threonylcarbamoyladenosine(37)-C(2))- methylthiotransferase MtaB n=1 Tax=Brotaphodocola sp. TaxID=3073577 RepID=UPI003D7DEEDC
MKRAALHNLGCKVNAYETEAMQQLLEEAGYEIVPFQDQADVYVINTCSVTNVADKKSRQMLHRAKKMNPGAVVVAAGCYVQAAAEELKKDLSVDVIIGNNKKKDLVPILEEYFAERERNGQGTAGQEAKNPSGEESKEHQHLAEDHVIEIGKTKEYEELKLHHTGEHTRAFLKVQDGCNQFCSYCIIPYTRGRVRSRRLEEVEKEVRELAEAGYQEIVLTGIHLSSYGLDFPEGERQTLLDLILRLEKVEKIKRIRLGSLEPRIVTEEFARALASSEKICPHFHLSLQSGCDETLKRMNRRYDTAEYREKCEILRRVFVNPAITTDVIVGFAGETEEEFAQTKSFLEEIGFYEMHIFKYSRRAGTRAAVMPNQVPDPVKAKRSDVLLELEKRQSLDYRKSFLGKEEEVLLEEETQIGGVTYLTGYTKEYVKVAYPAELGARNMLVRGKLTEMLTDEILLMRTDKNF